jgi:hypothetical protein
VPRWLILSLGILIAAAALYALLLEWPKGSPLGEIDAESRDQLERVLRERAEAEPRER